MKDKYIKLNKSLNGWMDRWMKNTMEENERKGD